MKAYLTVFCFLIAINCYGQSTAVIQKAHQNATVYMKKNLNDPASYKPVSFYGLVKVYSIPDTQKVINSYNDKIANIQLLMAQTDELRHNQVMKINNADSLSKDSIYLKAKIYIQKDKEIIAGYIKMRDIDVTNVKVTFQPKVIGYTMRHVFRAKNAYNATMLASWDFFIGRNGEILSVETKSFEERLQDLKEQYLKATNDLN